MSFYIYDECCKPTGKIEYLMSVTCQCILKQFMVIFIYVMCQASVFVTFL